MIQHSKNNEANRALCGFPGVPAIDYLFKIDRPAKVTTPDFGTRIVWLNLYKQGFYPNGKNGTDNYYSGATIELIELY